MRSASEIVARALRAHAEGRYAEAESALSAAAEFCRAEGEFGQLTLALSGLALARREVGRAEAAWRSVFDDALSAYEQCRDSADARADIGMRLGIAAGWLGLHDHAVELLASSLELLSSSPRNPGHESRVGQIRGLLVFALRDAGRTAEAIRLAESVVVDRRETEPDSPRVVGDLASLSSCYAAAGALDRARAALAEATTIQRSLYGDDDPGVVLLEREMSHLSGKPE